MGLMTQFKGLLALGGCANAELLGQQSTWEVGRSRLGRPNDSRSTSTQTELFQLRFAARWLRRNPCLEPA